MNSCVLLLCMPICLFVFEAQTIAQLESFERQVEKQKITDLENEIGPLVYEIARLQIEVQRIDDRINEDGAGRQLNVQREALKAEQLIVEDRLRQISHSLEKLRSQNRIAIFRKANDVRRRQLRHMKNAELQLQQAGLSDIAGMVADKIGLLQQDLGKYERDVDRKITDSEMTLPVLPDGIYLVERWTIERDSLFPLLENEKFFEYDESSFLDLRDEEPESVKFLAVNTVEFIPFDLAANPELAKNRDDGRNRVGLTFSDKMSGQMSDFSRRYLGRQVATLIDGQIITLHKIRSVIRDGRMQITRCTDNGCELILSRLSNDE